MRHFMIGLGVLVLLALSASAPSQTEAFLNNEAQAATTKKLLDPASAANTAAATSAWIDARNSEGDIMFINQVGAMTGSITWTIETASDGSGTGAAAVTPNEGAYSAGAANQIQKRTINAKASAGWVRCVGTIVTGPSLVAASISYRQKNF
jgi:hypothetical protein